MNGNLIGIACFLRHGETEYTNMFPDLTEQGKETIRSGVVTIKKFRDRCDGKIIICSSPAARALGSADIIAKEFGHKGGILKVPLLRQAQVRNPKVGQAIRDEIVTRSGWRGLSVAYGADPRYEDPKIFEPRSQVVIRFYDYLAELVSAFLSCNELFFVVHVSHYEVLYHFVEEIFRLDYSNGDDPLIFGEPIFISVYNSCGSKRVRFSVEFRGRVRNDIWFP